MDTRIQLLLTANERAVQILQRAAIVGSVCTIVIGILGLVGWQSRIPFLDIFTINPLASGTFICIGVALLFQIKNVPPVTLSVAFFLSLIFSTITFVLGIIVLFSFLFDAKIKIAQVLFINTSIGKNLSPDTSSMFFLIGAALLFFQFPLIKYFTRIGQVITLLAAVVTMFTVIGYTYQIFSLYQLIPFTPMPFSFAFTFAVICISLLAATSNHGIIKILTKNTASSKLALRLIVITLVLPAIIGYLLLLGQKLHIINTQTSIPFFVISTIVLFSTIIWVNTRILQKIELENLLIKSELEKENIELKIDTEKLASKALELEEKKEETYDYLTKANLISPPSLDRASFD